LPTAHLMPSPSLLDAPPISEWGPVELYPGAEVSDDDLEDYVRETVITYHHQVGTCKMGTDAMAVVSPRDFRVTGLHGLRVADASVMPMIPSGNTNAPTIMIAERAAQVFVHDVNYRLIPTQSLPAITSPKG